jgi:NADH-quinone oxidoreductase subunit J
MNELFYISAAVAVLATLLAISRAHAVHGLLYLIVSLVAVALVFFSLGAPFVAALEVITYAGAIMVLFLFVVMMLNLGPETTAQERRWMHPGVWIGPSVLSIILIALLGYVIFLAGPAPMDAVMVEPREVGIALFGPYLLGVQLAAILLMAGLIGAFHLGSVWRERPQQAAAGVHPSEPTERERAPEARTES